MPTSGLVVCLPIMRPLDKEETEKVFAKLINFIGDNVHALLERKDDPHVFRLHKDRVFYVSELVLAHASPFQRKDLKSFGTCLGKMTHSGKFHLHITALPILAQYAKYKVWVNESSALSFVYKNHVLKSGLVLMTENVPAHQGVVVYAKKESENDVPIGFGILARATYECQACEPGDIVVFHQADVGEYLRDEENLV
ncbi:Ribosome biogenesis factor NIP7 [Carpediemonas membranifera]|uniref:60S ribosome subunit biogenesis protein NIP7 homolog n=1 Tax=Carpediemonas membranifera TaxID=201153 RepID=A0A8J6B533_9EUKA|nr:Ribosome biogenesis factor NIP7 [Carpediemonas membranifera]|eukprot:KAG9393194.1 Ribosome biogenesis factor NIP7 [Carpediemonas membranifera]